MGIALAAMVANISAAKRGWEDKFEVMSAYAEKAQVIKDALISLVDEDTRAFNNVMAAFAMGKSSEAEKTIRDEAIQFATRYTMQVPFQVMEKSLESMEIIKAMAETGNPNSVTDAGVGAMCARTAVLGAFLNVKVNTAGLKDKTYCQELTSKGEEMVEKAKQIEAEILTIVNSKI
jgi:glutamate formiminotransferase/formiminotetrahydrofolate cyclodeaminase